MKKEKFILLWLSFGLLLFEITFELTPRLGYILYALLVLGVLWTYSKAYSEREDLKLLVMLVILPLLRISEVFLDVNFLIRTIAFYGGFAFLIIFYLIKYKIPIRSEKRSYILLPYVIIGGLLFGFISSKIIPLQTNFNLIYFLILISITEELYFRGLIQGTMKDLYSSNISIFASSVLYLIFSLSFGLSALFLFAMSVISAILYEKKGNIYLCIAFNLAVQFMLFVI
jgi:membrane protease YdiL (CAAX protease family)